MMSWLHIALIAAFSLLILVLLLVQIFQGFLHPKTRLLSQNGISRLHHQVNPLSPFFSWGDHPSLVADAVENGWPGFCFEGETKNVEFSWCEGSSSSSDYHHHHRMQKVRVRNSSLCVIRTALPLPGPRFGNSCFPQQPYFEITILLSAPELLTVGLTGGGEQLPLKCPGSFPGSIGFNSTGSVYLNGRKLVLESEKDEWGGSENVIGCGFNPTQKRVFFTLNSQLLHDIHCKTHEFGHPLFPTIAAAAHDITLLLNLGQKPFRFEPGNSQRTPNPCLHQQEAAGCCSIEFEDSADLFSVGSNNNTVNSCKAAIESDQESDLFEIHLGHHSFT